MKSMISNTTIEKFRAAALKDHGRDLTFAEASEILHGLVGYFDLLAKIQYRIITKNKPGYDAKNTTNK